MEEKTDLNCHEATHLFWLSFDTKEKHFFLKKHHDSIIKAAVDTMNTIGVKGAVCMVCIVKNLELDVALLKNELRVRQIVNRAIGKTWSKPSKQKKHNTSNSHEVQHFCTSKHAVAKELHMWRLGLMPIGGVWCSAPNLWSSERLKVWLSEQTGGIKGVKVVKKKIVNVKRPLSNPFEIPAKKAKATHSSREKDPIERLRDILPRLEQLVITNESSTDHVKRELQNFLHRFEGYATFDSFEVFSHPADPVLFNVHEKKVYCKQCHFYVLSHTVSRKKDKFYVNHGQPCSFPLTGRGHHKYGKGTGRKELLESHWGDNQIIKNSKWRWACGIFFDNTEYTPISFLNHHSFTTKHLESSTHTRSMVWWFESKDRISRGVKILGDHFWVMVNNVCTATASNHYDPTLYLLHAFGTDIGDTQVVSNVANSYVEQIRLYLDALFSISILTGKHPKTNWYHYAAYSADKGTVGEANQLMLGAGFRDVTEYRWIMLSARDAYETIVTQPKVTFKQAYNAVKRICNRFNISVKQFWSVFKNFSGDGPFTNKGKPWIYGILFFIAVREKRNWLRTDTLEEMRKRERFSYDGCTYADALKLLKLPSEITHFRTLDWCHGVSGVLKNIQLAKVIIFKKCENISVFFNDMEAIMNGFDDQVNTGKRYSHAKKAFVTFKQN